MASTLCALLVLLGACADLTDPPAITIGDAVLTVADLREIWAAEPSHLRSPLTTRDDRRAFAESVIERRLLLAEGERILSLGDTLTAALLARDRSATLVRRLRVIEGGRAEIDSTELHAAWERMKTTHWVEWLSFASEQVASETAQRIIDGGSLSKERARPDVGTSEGERLLVWTPHPDPLADAIVELSPGDTAGPLLVEGEWLVVRLVRREPRDPGPFMANLHGIARGLRTRCERDALSALARSLWSEADLEIDEDVIGRLAARTTESILRPGITELAPDWAVPALAEGEAATVVARRGGDPAFLIGDYVEAVRRRSVARRPRAGALESEIRRVVREELDTFLLLEEAERRHLADDWFVRQSVARKREERLVQLASESIMGAKRANPAAVDSLIARIRRAEPNVFQIPERARILRFDFASRAAARRELANIRRAGGAAARLREVLEGRSAPLAGTYHIIYLTREGIGPDLDRAVFRGGEGTLGGPFEYGNLWIIVHCLEIEPAGELSADAAHERLWDTMGRDPSAVKRWIEARRREASVAVDEEALDAIGPAG